MNTQNTPVHVKLWHKDFWLMAVANLLVTASFYMQIPLLPSWMLGSGEYTPEQTADVLGVSGIGIFALGFFCSFLVQHYRRNIVCIKAILLVAACIFALYYVQSGNMTGERRLVLLTVVRFAEGAVFGLAQMVLSSTLIIDKCESFQRTEANHSAAWFARMAMSAGPMATAVLLPRQGFGTAAAVGVSLCLVAAACLLMIKFPFKAPYDKVRKISSDRFFLPQGKWLFVNLALSAAAIGLFFSARQDTTFYGMLMVGFFLALLAQRFVFVNAELKSEVTTGLLLIIASLLLMLSGNRKAAVLFSPVLTGCGTGIVGARFLLFFLKLSKHCQRGTSQSTFFLSWEFGISAGLFAGYYFFFGDIRRIVVSALAISFASLVMYLAFTHKWYMKNKNR